MKLLICGDTVPTDASQSAFVSGDLNALFGNLLSLFQEADRVILNLECALTTSEKKISKMGPHLKGPPICAHTLARAGVTDCGLSNNHILDYGTEGLSETCQVLNDEGLSYTGVGANEKEARRIHYIQGKKETIAVIAVAEHEYSYALPHQAGAWAFDPFETMADISEACEKADYVLVLYHGGKEHCRYPSPRLRKACQAMVRSGANLVLCQHSHCIGCCESYDNGEILYGQGNFHFIKYQDNPEWNEGLVVQVDTGNEPHVCYLPVVLSGDCGIDLAVGDGHDTIMNEFHERSEKLQHHGLWLSEWQAFCDSVASDYREKIRLSQVNADSETAAELFPHYLDCEAHSDVLHTIYPSWHRKG
jgi:hypothetical protein